MVKSNAVVDAAMAHMMDEVSTEEIVRRLNHIGGMKTGDSWPDFLCVEPNRWNWGEPLSALCRRAAKEIEQRWRPIEEVPMEPYIDVPVYYRFRALIPVWSPIATAPVPSHARLKDGRWHCLMQDAKGTVRSGFAAYMQARRGNAIRRSHAKQPTIYALQWYTESTRTGRGRVFKPSYWMPLPEPRMP